MYVYVKKHDVMYQNKNAYFKSLLYCLFLPPTLFAQSAVVSTNQTRILYAHLENEVSVVMPGYRCDDLLLEADNCNIEGKDCTYLITPKEEVKQITLIITHAKTKKVLDKIQLPVRRLADPRVIIARGKDNAGPIIKDGPIIISDNCTYVESFFKILEFEITILRGDSIVFQHKTINSHFDAVTIAAIDSAQNGDKLFMEEIRVMGPDRKTRLFNTIAYKFR